MKRSKLWYDDAGVYRLNTLAQWEARKRRSQRVQRLLLCLMGLALGAMFVYYS